MANIDILKTGGVISQNATFNATDQAIIDSLTTDEANALVSIKGKLTAEFVANNIGSAGAAAKTIGIVF